MYCKDINKNYFEGHDLFLKKIIANFLVKLINKPTISEIKPIVFNAYVSLYSKGELDFQTDSKQILENEILFKEQFFKANKLIPSLLTLNLYLKYPNQKPIFKAEIEHIFPKTTNWRPSYTGWNKEEAEPFIESIGNKMWLEKRLNIKASNGYFDEKKEKYKNSGFLEAQDLAKYSKNDWLKEDIEQRNEEIYKRLKEFFENNVK
ncbi:HNH endonuclease family protein [Campylobacter taeniopygiae]|uniref:HNH endonuclease family protein n=1 Tax=Campylobacter taeniopygiae TaxID=2510188 RepID=UPI003D6BFC7B